MGKSKSIKDGVAHFRERCRDAVDGGPGNIARWCLTKDKGEVEDEFIVICEAQ